MKTFIAIFAFATMIQSAKACDDEVVWFNIGVTASAKECSARAYDQGFASYALRSENFACKGLECQVRLICLASLN